MKGRIRDVDVIASIYTIFISVFAYLMIPIMGLWALATVFVVPLQWCYYAYTHPLTVTHEKFGRLIDRHILRKKV